MVDRGSKVALEVLQTKPLRLLANRGKAVHTEGRQASAAVRIAASAGVRVMRIRNGGRFLVANFSAIALRMGGSETGKMPLYPFGMLRETAPVVGAKASVWVLRRVAGSRGGHDALVVNAPVLPVVGMPGRTRLGVLVAINKGVPFSDVAAVGDVEMPVIIRGTLADVSAHSALIRGKMRII